MSSKFSIHILPLVIKKNVFYFNNKKDRFTKLNFKSYVYRMSFFKSRALSTEIANLEK